MRIQYKHNILYIKLNYSRRNINFRVWMHWCIGAFVLVRYFTYGIHCYLKNDAADNIIYLPTLKPSPNRLFLYKSYNLFYD